MIHFLGTRRLRVLVVDGHPDSGESLGLLLRLWGHDAEVVRSGPEALAAAAARPPDVVLTEIVLPEMDGYQLASRLRERPDGRGLLLIAVTGVGGDAYHRRAWEAGFDQYLIKPVDPGALQALLALNYLSPAEFAAETAGVVMEPNPQPEGWYYKESGTLVGPVSAEEIRRLLGARRLQAGDTVWRRWRRDQDTLFFPAPARAVLDRPRPAGLPSEMG
jgi:CheY-like chemotaxis protein